MKTNNPNQDNPKIIRWRGYSRTSGKDKTSISTQQEGEERFGNSQPNWKCTGHYVDRCKSGAKVAGRDDYQKALKDLANDEFDILVPFDISRYGRDGLSIIRDSEMLKRNFGKYVVDSKGQFDNRDHRKVMTNFIFAGVAEGERLSIMERTIGGRIKKAEMGLQWCSNPPVGRAFKKTGKNSGEWYITKKGYELRELLTRVANGSPLITLTKKYGISTPEVIHRNVRESQLAGTYHAVFNAPEIGIKNLKIAIPGMPSIITSKLQKRLQDIFAYNKRWNKQFVSRQYRLSSFVMCNHCGQLLKARTNKNIIYYRHYANSKKSCPYKAIRGDVLESNVLDYLYNLCLDKPAFNKAVKDALPDDEDRKALEKDIKQVNKQLARLDKEESNLAKAVRDGMEKTSVIIAEQRRIIDERKFLEKRRDELNQTMMTMPDPQRIKHDGAKLQEQLMEKYRDRDWRKIPYDEVREFLHFLFGDNPKKNNLGIFVGLQDGEWKITFQSCISYCFSLITGECVPDTLQTEGLILKKDNLLQNGAAD